MNELQSRILFFFEDHSDYDARRSFIQILPYLQEYGRYTFGAEVSGGLDDKIQEFKDFLLAHRLGLLDSDDQNERSMRQYFAENYSSILPMFEEIKRLKMDFVGLDKAQPDIKNNSLCDEREKEMTKQSNIDERNEYMEKNLHRLFASSENRIIYYGGLAHAQYFFDCGLASGENTFYLYTTLYPHGGYAHMIQEKAPGHVIDTTKLGAMNLLRAELKTYFSQSHLLFGMVRGLKNAMQYNGKLGKSKRFRDGRHQVELLNGQAIKVRPANFSLMQQEEYAAISIQSIVRGKQARAEAKADPTEAQGGEEGLESHLGQQALSNRI